ncbi:unnamed protein product, partial [Allacma fusca]
KRIQIPIQDFNNAVTSFHLPVTSV